MAKQPDHHDAVPRTRAGAGGPVPLRFVVPLPPKHHVDRPRLMTRLDQAAQLPLTLVSAPAGSGKTTVVAAWVAGGVAEPVGWMTFEAGDDQPSRFWPLVTQCLDLAGVGVTRRVRADSVRDRRRLLLELSASLANLDHRVTLVLDGYDLSDRVLAGEIDFVLHHSGQRLRLVVLTRLDPVLPLHRYRLADTMAEVRMSDLAFTEHETAEVLEEAGVTLSTDSAAELTRRTRGWAAALRFAALLLQRSEQPDLMVRELAGDSGNIAEYLMAEMLQTQPPRVRDLLLRTSVVDVLRPGLIEELGGHAAGRQLASLVRANVLVEEVPEHPGWYRYHPLLRDLLRAELSYASPSRYTRLRKRAAAWFAAQGMVAEAAALAAGSAAWAEAAGYAVDGWALGRLLLGDDSAGLITTLRATPHDESEPSVSAVRAAVALADDDTDECARELTSVRRAVEDGGAAPSANLVLAADVLEAALACAVGDEGAVDLADRAVARLAVTAPPEPGSHAELAAFVQAEKGWALVQSGELDQGAQVLSEAAELVEPDASSPVSARSLSRLALASCLQGRLRRARALALRSLSVAAESGMSPEQRPRAADLALAWVFVEGCDLSRAHEHLDVVLRSARLDPVVSPVADLVRARLLRARGDVDGVLTLVEALITDGRDGWLADLLRLEAAEARVAQGESDLAARIAHRAHGGGRSAALVVMAHAQLAGGQWPALAESTSELVARDDDASTQAAVTGHLLDAAHELHRGRPGPARAAVAESLRL